MIQVQTLIVGELQTNCYLVSDGKSGDCIIIDPGDDMDYISARLTDLDLTPKAIILTHGHSDHALAAGELRAIYKIPIFVNSKDLFLEKRNQSPFTLSLDFPLTRCHLVTLGKLKFRVIETPGHTPGSVCLYNSKEGVLFSGDLIFDGGGVGRTDFSYCNVQDLIKSINQILKLPGDTIVYPGHGEVFRLSSFKFAY